MHIVRWVFSRHGGGEPPSAATVARAEELEHVRQFFWFYSRSAAATVNNISSADGRIRKFEADGAPLRPFSDVPRVLLRDGGGLVLSGAS
jgi:hypothetical protein